MQHSTPQTEIDHEKEKNDFTGYIIIAWGKGMFKNIIFYTTAEYVPWNINKSLVCLYFNGESI